jgi:hypothetical protein
MPKLNIFQTSESRERLSALIESLREPPGYGPGREVRKDEKVRGKYILVTTGQQSLKDQCIRVNGNSIISGEVSNLLEETLRNHKIPYLLFNEVEIDNPNDKDLILPLQNLKPQVVYTP